MTRIPEPWERNAPCFHAGEEGKLRQFISYMNRLMSLAKTPVADRKSTLVLYVDRKIAEQWKAFPSFKNGTPEEFIAEIINHYPSVKDSETGSISILNKALAQFPDHGVSVNDQDGLLKLIREVQMELKKLIPRMLNNKQGVGRFIEKLDPAFTTKMWSRLEMNEIMQDSVPVDPADMAAVVARKLRMEKRETEGHLFDDVLTVVRLLARENASQVEYDNGATTSQNSLSGAEISVKSEIEAMLLALDKRNNERIHEMKQWTLDLMEELEAKRNTDLIKLDQFMNKILYYIVPECQPEPFEQY